MPRTRLPLTYRFPPMEAKLVETIPEGDVWSYEPKWDGFRCLAFKNGTKVELRSKSGNSLTRYFPEIVDAVANIPSTQFVLDGELVVPHHGHISFDALLQRIHPAASRITLLSKETPATYVVFDMLVDIDGEKLIAQPLPERRKALHRFIKRDLRTAALRRTIRLSPSTTDVRLARRWLSGRDGLDGVIAKRIDLPYHSGDRLGMQKVKRIRTAECVVGGFRYASKKKVIGSLLLGLYDGGGLLHHVGFTSSFTDAERKSLVSKVVPLIKPPGFTGQTPGGPSRWSTKRSSEWEPLAPKLVVEVMYDHFTDGRFRHGTTFLRWRPDKAPKQCTIEQVEAEGRSALKLLQRGQTARR